MKLEYQMLAILLGTGGAGLWRQWRGSLLVQRAGMQEDHLEGSEHCPPPLGSPPGAP